MVALPSLAQVKDVNKHLHEVYLYFILVFLTLDSGVSHFSDRLMSRQVVAEIIVLPEI